MKIWQPCIEKKYFFQAFDGGDRSCGDVSQPTRGHGDNSPSGRWSRSDAGFSKGVSRDRCYDPLRYFCQKQIGENIGAFDSKQS
jgi:hypothetical protein